MDIKLMSILVDTFTTSDSAWAEPMDIKKASVLWVLTPAMVNDLAVYQQL
jgi:hypothetical protein